MSGRIRTAPLGWDYQPQESAMNKMMKAAVFIEPGRIELADKPIPDVGPNDALMRITTTTICGTDIHILKGEYPVAKGLTVGHEPVGVIEKLGSAVQGYQEGQRVIAGAICPNFNSYAAQDGVARSEERRVGKECRGGRWRQDAERRRKRAGGGRGCELR